MTLSYPTPEFDDAVAAVCHGTASDDQVRALNALLLQEPAARDEYLFRLELHARLASDPDLFDSAGDMAPGCIMPSEQFEAAHSGRLAENVSPAGWPRWPAALALAAAVAVLALGSWVWWSGRVTPRGGFTSNAVAMLTRTVDAQWGGDQAGLQAGSALAPGWLRLESGLAQVVFYSGARMVIEGPAELRLVSPTEAVCPSGRLLAEVPGPARGFKLRTSQLDLVDRGTSFGVDSTGRRTEVHVFKGEVDLAPRGSGRVQSLKEHEAARVREGAAPQLMAANAAVFAPMFEFHQRSLAYEAFRYERWQFAGAQLNQDPSLLVRLDFEGLGGTDWALANKAQANRSVPEATVVGCMRAEGRWREKQALEFQSVNDRVRLSVPGDYEALTLAAWVCVKGLDREFNSLVMCDGFQPGTLHWLIRQDGVLGLTVFGGDPGRFQIMASPPVLSLDDLGHWLHLAVVVDGVGREVAHYVNGLPVSRHALKLGPPYTLDGVELGNWNAMSGPDPAPFLVRNLSGSFDEFCLFRRALTDAEILALHAQGRP